MLVNSWQKFADVTIGTNDLDPMYEFFTSMRNSTYGEDYTDRVMMHFVLFYHIGEAIDAANYTGQQWWTHVWSKFGSCRRGTERRHFRGKQGMDALTRLQRAVDGAAPEDAFRMMTAPSYTELMNLFTKGRFEGTGFGTYFVWKILDLQERVLLNPISVTHDEALKYLPDEPRKCAAHIWPHRSLSAVLHEVCEYIADYPVPTTEHRTCGIQEAETILCMLKGYFITKKHVIGDDIREKHSQLAAYPHLLRFLPPTVELEEYVRGELVTP